MARRGLGTGVPIVAFGRVCCERASGIAACIVGAAIAIITCQRRTRGTLAVFAAIANSAVVSVIAIGKVKGELAALLGVTAIVGAGIVIVAGERISHACTRFTMVGLGAGIAVDTFAFIQWGMNTSFATATTVFGTWVTVVTGSLIDAAVTVIVHTVAFFGGRGSCVACIESQLRTSTVPFASPMFVFRKARGRKVGCHGVISAATYPG